MVQSNDRDLPILIAGGGIGGLATLCLNSGS